MERREQKDTVKPIESKEELLIRIVYDYAEKLAPRFSDEWLQPAQVPSRSGATIEGERDWFDTPWTKGIVNIVYCQLYKNEGLLPGDIGYHRPTVAEQQQRNKEVNRHLAELLLLAEVEEWRPQRLFAELANKFVMPVDQGIASRVESRDVMDAVSPYLGNSYAKRFLSMQCISALATYAPHVESQMFRMYAEPPEEWKILHEQPELTPIDEWTDAKLASMLEVVKADQADTQYYALEQEIKLYADITEVDRELVEQVLNVFQQVFVYAAYRMGYTAKDLPYLVTLFKPQTITTNEIIAGVTSYTIAGAGKAAVEDGSMRDQAVVLYSAPLVADVLHYFLRGEISGEELVVAWTNRINHELHHSRVAMKYPAYAAFKDNIIRLTNQGVLDERDTYDFSVLENAAYEWGNNTSENIQYPSRIRTTWYPLLANAQV